MSKHGGASADAWFAMLDRSRVGRTLFPSPSLLGLFGADGRELPLLREGELVVIKGATMRVAWERGGAVLLEPVDPLVHVKVEEP